MTRSFCPDGHESAFWTEVEAEPALTDGPVATCPVAGCGLLIRFCDWCDRPGTGWATVDPIGDDGEPHESVIYACGLHLNLLTSGVHPPCVVCGEPVDWPSEWECRRCARMGEWAS